MEHSRARAQVACCSFLVPDLRGRKAPTMVACFILATLLAAAAPVSNREFDLPTPDAHPHDPAAAPDGSLWFTEQKANKLGRLDPKSGQMRESPLPTADSGPHGLVADG